MAGNGGNDATVLLLRKPPFRNRSDIRQLEPSQSVPLGVNKGLGTGKRGFRICGAFDGESTNAMPKEVEMMSNVMNVRKNWGKWTRESRKRNKSKDPVKSPDWYAGRYEDQLSRQGE